MSDNGGTGGTSQEGGAGTSQGTQEVTGTEGGNEAPNGTEGTNGTATGNTELTIEQILETIQDPAQKSYLEKLAKDAKESRGEAGKYRTQYQTEKQAREALERQNETDAQRLEREQKERDERLETLQQENRNLRVHSALEATAGTVGAHNPKRVRELLDSSVELDDKGEPTNIQALLSDLKKSDPYLFKKANNDANEGSGNAGGGGGGVGTSMNDFIRGGRR